MSWYPLYLACVYNPIECRYGFNLNGVLTTFATIELETSTQLWLLNFPEAGWEWPTKEAQPFIVLELQQQLQRWSVRPHRTGHRPVADVVVDRVPASVLRKAKSWPAPRQPDPLRRGLPLLSSPDSSAGPSAWMGSPWRTRPGSQSCQPDAAHGPLELPAETWRCPENRERLASLKILKSNLWKLIFLLV